MFPIVQVDRRQADAVEPLGSKSKFWYRDGKRRILFKAEERGTGEDWAEKIACELCRMLGLPHVHYDLAFEVEQTLPGVVCKNIAPRPPWLAHGNQLMLEQDSSYPAGEVRKYKVREHTVDAVSAIVRTLEKPTAKWTIGLPKGVETALGVFVGYVMLDAWIANQDRHHENWAALKDTDDSLSLAPTFDHGASLARNVSDTEKYDRMNTKDQRHGIGAFARRARSAFYAGTSQEKSMFTIDAWRAFARHSPDEARIWLNRLEAIDDDAIDQILAKIPPQRMSAVCHDFTLQLLRENKNRLLSEDPK